MRITSSSVLTLLVVAGLLSGCSKASHVAGPAGPESPATPVSDQTQVSDQVAANPQYVDDGVFESEDPTPADVSGAGAAPPEEALAAIRPIDFWRRITEVRRSFEFAFSDTDSTGRPTRAVVTVNKALLGTFNILTASPADSIFQRNVVHKPLADHWVRRILLQRVRVPGYLEQRWRIAATSGVKVTSRGASTRIVSLRVQSTGYDSTITDPLAFFRLRQVIRFAAEDSVRLTVTTLTNDDVVVLQHADRRFRLRNNGDNTYTGVFRTGTLAGLRHVGVNALSHGTLFDDVAPYDSQAWLVPYVVRPLEIAAFEP